MNATPSVQTLDATGLRCPLPVLKARRILKGLPPGSRLEILTDDPVSPIDMRFFCETEGHVIVEAREGKPPYRFLIERADGKVDRLSVLPRDLPEHPSGA